MLVVGVNCEDLLSEAFSLTGETDIELRQRSFFRRAVC
jgi:hypothetical protein